MYLKDYFSNLKKKYYNYSFSGIASQSSKIKKNFIFFAIKGNKYDGHDFISEAIKNGAKIIIHEKRFTGIENKILFINSKNIRKLLAEVSFKINPKIPKNLIAVTGTNGKSSISDFYYQILKLNKIKVASIGTLGIKKNNSIKILANTTMDPINLSIELKKLKNQKIENVIMEASSHGLKQHRLDGLVFDIGVFSNLSHDHLDYHKNLRDYFESKLYLFKNLIKKNGNIITDQSIKQFFKIKNISKNKNLQLNYLSLKKENSQIFISSHKFKNESQLIELNYRKNRFKFLLNLIGKVQLKNLLMAVIAAEKSGLNIKNIFNCLSKIKPINGRLEKIGKINNNSKVILDYAHTPDALKIVLENLNDQFLKKKIFEIADRKKAINQAILDLKSGEILLVAGKGHEKTQIYKKQIRYFSDKEIILKSINKKNHEISKNIKLNIIKDLSNSNLNFKNLNMKKIIINSKEVNKNDIFFTIKGKKNDAHNYLKEVFERKASLAIVNKLNKYHSPTKQIKVSNTLEFLTSCASRFRDNIDTKIIAITGSCGKTSLKDLLSLTLRKSFKTSFSKKSFNNKYGVPLSLLNINSNDIFGVLEVGMDKKGEIDFLSKMIMPDIGIITNVSFAHIKNFKNISEIASAKGEIINNIKKNGSVILNADDDFFTFHKRIAEKRKLKIFTFSKNKKNTTVNLKKIIKQKNKYKIILRVNNSEKYFFIRKNFQNFIYNLMATLTVMQIYININKLSKNEFLNIETTKGRGDIIKLNLNGKSIFLVDESYNSNPLSLSSALENFDKILVNKNKKHIILGDMLELGKHSKKLHKDMGQKINKISLNKVHVIGKEIKETFKKIKLKKRGSILKNDSELNKLILEELRDGDYLMIKGSNSTGLFNFVTKLKKVGINAL